MRYSLFALAIAAGITASPASAGANFVTNGDFSDLTNGVGQITELYDITYAVGWTTWGYNKVMSDGNVAVMTQHGDAPNFALWTQANGGASTWDGLAPNGSNFVAMNSVYNADRVYQTIDGLTAGDRYTLAFDNAFGQQRLLDGSGYDGPTTQTFSVYFQPSSASWDQNDPVWSMASDLPSHGFEGWFAENLTLTATSASEVLSFFVSGSPSLPPYSLFTNVSLTEGAVPEPATWAMALAGFAGLGLAGWRSARKAARAA